MTNLKYSLGEMMVLDVLNAHYRQNKESGCCYRQSGGGVGLEDE